MCTSTLSKTHTHAQNTPTALGSGLAFANGVLRGVPNSLDTFASPIMLTVAAADPKGLSVSANVTLVVDGQCSTQVMVLCTCTLSKTHAHYAHAHTQPNCFGCIGQGCRWVGTVCQQDCPKGAVCTVDAQQCPGRKQVTLITLTLI